MKGVFRKLLFIRNLLSRKKPKPDNIVEETWTADFSKPKHARFIIKSESSYDANLRKNQFYSGYSLTLGLKKTGCLAWVEAPEYRYRDHIISGTLRIDPWGGYGAGGVYFRMVDGGTFYSFLISSKGYFRLDAVRNGTPYPLVGWTELPLSNGAMLGPDQSVDFSIVIFGSHIIILIRGRWAAEIDDSSIAEGCVCFAAASYEAGDPTYRVIREDASDSTASVNVYVAEVFLEAVTIDSRVTEASAQYDKWRDSPDIDSKARLNLAETLTAMNQHNEAMIQLRKGWESGSYRKTQKEFLLAGRLALQLGLISEAESYISQCYQADLESAEGKEALVEMAKILDTGERYAELKNFCAEAVKIKPNDALLWNISGHAHWNLKEYKKAAIAYDKAFSLSGENGIFAKNAANVYEVMNSKKEALQRYLEAGRAFLKTGNYNDLGLIVPMLLSVGENNWEARSLAGKWAFAVEDWGMAETEFKRAEDLRKGIKPSPKKDGAQVFLEALLLIRAGKRQKALPHLREAASLEKEYALFHFRLAENIFLLEDNPDNPEMLNAMHTALALSDRQDEDITDNTGNTVKDTEGLAGWINNFAAQVSLSKGNLDEAVRYLEKARAVLGNLPAVKVNQAVLFYLKDSLDKALGILDGDKQDDPDGVMANCAGNLLVRSGRLEDADKKYIQALSIKPDNVEYLCNRASCLMEQGLFGEADELLARAHTIAPSPALLEMISYVAVKKGEYQRAEQACLSALEMDPAHTQSLLSLGWIYMTLSRAEGVDEVLQRLDGIELGKDTAKSRDELQARLNDLLYKTIKCASCDRSWKVLKDPPATPAMRLFATPPDDLPAGTCPNCGETFCIGCAKNNLDPSGRFICSSCDRSLKLANEGLKKLIYDWANKDGLEKTIRPETSIKKQGGDQKADKKPGKETEQKTEGRKALAPIEKDNAVKKTTKKTAQVTEKKPEKKPEKKAEKKTEKITEQKTEKKTEKKPDKKSEKRPVKKEAASAVKQSRTRPKKPDKR